MFEKEAEEYFETECLHSYADTEEQLNGDIEKHNKIVELKEKYDTCLRENTGLKIHSAYVEKKLAEAKELLREIIDTPVSIQMGGEVYENEGYAELVEETEQFLKECE